MPPVLTTAPPRNRPEGRQRQFAGLDWYWVLALLAAVYVVLGSWDVARGPPQKFDFFGIWSFAQFVWTQPDAAGVYDLRRLQAFQQKLAPGFQGFFPCPYPPAFLWLIQWLGALPLGLARAAWSLGGVAALAGAMALLFRGRLRRYAVVLPFVAIVSLQNWVNGETGYFTGALLVAGFALVDRRPVLAGIAFGLLTAKPQLGVVVPFALLGLGAWRTILTASVTALALAAAACASFGATVWGAWAGALAGYQALTAINGKRLVPLMTSVQSAATSLRAPPAVAWACQAEASIVACGAVWLAFRRGHRRLAVALALVAVPVAAPHGFTYDLTALAAAMLLVGEHYLQRGARIPLPWLALFFWVGVDMPAFVAALPGDVPTALSELLLFSAVARLALRA
jgi:hypothetical protein